MKLPTYDDLSKEQDGIYNLALDGNHLVTGPPGTGKSVMALYRAQALTFMDREPTVLMFSNVLKQYTREAAKELGIEGNVETFHRWLTALWKRHYHEPAPKTGADLWAIDWSEVAHRIMRNPPPRHELRDLIIDEGQDLSRDFYAWTGWLASNVTVFADENQQIREEQCTLEEIRKAIEVPTDHRLTRNYRNSREIAALARHYYVGTPTGLPDVPTRSGETPTLTNHRNTNDVVEEIARFARAYSDQSIGVALYYGRTQKSMFNRLAARDLPTPVETYIYKDPNHRTVDFDKPGVKIINFQSLKGLEFDTLFVPHLEAVPGDPTSATMRMLFYVVTSRARRELRLSWCGDGHEPRIVADVPHHVLERL